MQVNKTQGILSWLHQSWLFQIPKSCSNPDVEGCQGWGLWKFFLPENSVGSVSNLLRALSKSLSSSENHQVLYPAQTDVICFPSCAFPWELPISFVGWFLKIGVLGYQVFRYNWYISLIPYSSMLWMQKRNECILYKPFTHTFLSFRPGLKESSCLITATPGISCIPVIAMKTSLSKPRASTAVGWETEPVNLRCLNK